VGQRGFTSQDAALTINYIGFVYRTLVAEGYSPERLLQATGLTGAALVSPDFRCTFEQHKTFVINAMNLANDPHLGPRMAARFNPMNIGLPASAAMSSDIFSTALHVLQQFMSLNFSILSFDYYADGDTLALRWKPALDVSSIEYFVMGSTFVVTENFLRLLLGKESVAVRVDLAMPEPAGWVEYASALSFPVVFDAPFSQLVVPSCYLNEPLSAADPVVHQHMLRLCEKQMAEAFFDEGLESQVGNIIIENHYHSMSIEQVAEALGLSERSLRRQLSQSGSAYKKIVDQVRESRARELLAIAGLPISTIAYDLGFSDPSNFARTFKRWLGVSPQDYRAQSLTGQD